VLVLMQNAYRLTLGGRTRVRPLIGCQVGDSTTPASLRYSFPELPWHISTAMHTIYLPTRG